MAARKYKMPLFVLICTLTLALGYFAFSANAEEKKSSSEPATDNTVQSTDELSSMKVGKDPDGALRPTTKEEDKALAAQIRNTLKQYKQQSLQIHSNGAKSVITVPFSLAFSVAHKGAEGKVTYNCSSANSLEETKTAKKSQELAEE
jgi:hypothetical protein